MEYVGRAIREAIVEHHRAGNHVAIWEDGRVVYWYPDGSKRPAEEVDAAEQA